MAVQFVNACWRIVAGSDFQAYESHELDSVAPGDDAVLQLEVELHFSVFDVVLEVDVAEAWVVLAASDVGEGEIVGADEADSAGVQQGLDDAFGSDEAVLRVCPLEEFVEEKEDRGMLFGEVADVTQASDLGVEAGTAGLE
jgi:hypothetical protein